MNYLEEPGVLIQNLRVLNTLKLPIPSSRCAPVPLEWVWFTVTYELYMSFIIGRNNSFGTIFLWLLNDDHRLLMSWKMSNRVVIVVTAILLLVTVEMLLAAVATSVSQQDFDSGADGGMKSLKIELIKSSILNKLTCSGHQNLEIGCHWKFSWASTTTVQVPRWRPRQSGTNLTA